MGGNPVMGIDPLGLLVKGVLDATKHTLTITDIDTGETITIDNAFTGGNVYNHGKIESPGAGKEIPAPEGKYYITINPTPSWGSGQGKEFWFGLLYQDEKIDDYHDGRDGFRLHGGQRSFGCATVSTYTKQGRKNWDKVFNFIRNTKYDSIVYENSIRLSDPLQPAPDFPIRHYGELEIINVPKN